MISCDVSPLTYDILTHSLWLPKEWEVLKTEMPENVYKKISHFNPWSLSAYFGQKTKEYVHMLLLERYLAEKEKRMKFTLSLFTSDVMNGVDVRFCLNNSCRISADLTALDLIEDKIKKYKNHMYSWNVLNRFWKWRAWDNGHKTGMLLIGIPTLVNHISSMVINQSESIDEAKKIIDTTFPRNRRSMRDITILWLDDVGKKWAAKNIYN